MGVRVDVQGTFNFAAVADSIFSGLVQGKNQAGEFLLAKSIEQVPMDVGNPGLMSSGQVEQAANIDDDVQVVFDTPYAARLHEHPEYHFSTKSNPGAKGKYLEDPAVENRKEIGNIIRAGATRGEITGG